MFTLILNLGSTSFKFELFDSESLRSVQAGNFPMESSGNNIQTQVDKITRDVLRQVGDIGLIEKIGHRVVHGGDDFFEPTKVTPEILTQLEKQNHLAPLHNPYNLAGINACQKYLPNVLNFAVFDTGFFHNLPESAKVYPIPYKYYEQYGIKKFGFHGISHQFAVSEGCQKAKLDYQKVNIITVHLGGGCSVAAIEKGKPIDTSMGLTPLEGLMMQTRSGDIGEGVVIQILENLLANDNDIDVQTAINQLRDILNYNSGIKGISGYSNYLDLLSAVKENQPQAKLTFDMFIHRIKKYIGAYAAILGSVNLLVFTGQVGAGDPLTRKKVTDKLKILEKTKVVVVEPHEELAIARLIKQINTDR